MNFTYGLFVYENAASLDFIGPSDVFVISSYLLKKGRIITIAETPGSIKCIGGLEVIPGAAIYGRGVRERPTAGVDRLHLTFSSRATYLAHERCQAPR